MTNDELKLELNQLMPAAATDTNGAFLTWEVEALDWYELAKQLRNNQNLGFDFLFCLTCIDWKTHLTMVYHLRSTTFLHELVVKCKLETTNPVIESVSAIWRTAEFHEREVYELFGVRFNNHPDLRLLILPDGWEGKNPLRKNFEDPVNMIKL